MIHWCDRVKISRQHIKHDSLVCQTKVPHHATLSHHLHVFISSLSYLKSPSVPSRRDSAAVHFLFWKRTRELVGSGLPCRHTQEALLEPRLNPSLLCLTLHTSTPLKEFSNILDSLLHLNSSETQKALYSMIQWPWWCYNELRWDASLFLLRGEENNWSV